MLFTIIRAEIQNVNPTIDIDSWSVIAEDVDIDLEGLNIIAIDASVPKARHNMERGHRDCLLMKGRGLRARIERGFSILDQKG